MDNVYGKNYDVAVYDDAQRWTAYFKPIAARIAAELAPKSVLDAGCGHGFLVAALRDLGIEAWGLDLSEAALSKARSDVREYCAAGTIAGPLPEELPARFDLAVCIETMQYLHEDDVRAAVATLCAAADAVLFVSSPEDMNQPAHLNSRQPEYWARLFAERGFLPNLRYTPDFIAPHARLFEKHAIDARAIEEYEHFRRVLDRENRALKDDAQRLNAACDQYRAMIASLDNEVKELRGSTCWKITYPVRKTLDLLKIACRNGGRAAVYYRRHGAAKTFSRIARELRRSSPAPVPVPNDDPRYLSWIERYDTLTDEKMKRVLDDMAQWSEKPLISILMPVYNTNLAFLREAVDSVRAQVYPNWQLCIADDASQGRELKDYLRSLSSDPRIKVVFRETNGHICEASNSALELCDGVFTVLMDHDDTISPAALYEVARTLRAHPDANVIYSDEDKIDERDKRNDPFFKCNWDPYRILCQNYVSHLGAYRTSLLKEIGGFRKGYEGSQDHDLLLRATLRSRDDQIVHVPKVLYHWRHYTGTGSFSDAFLKKCEQVRRQCVRDYLAARGFKATVAEGYNGYNKVVFALPAPLPRVTCIVPAKDHADLTERCIDGVLQTNYQNLEVILVDNGSTEPDALELCRRYEREGKVRVIRWNKPFNYSEINNMAAREATGEYLLLLNNDVKPIATDWLTLMLGYASQSDVGCVGARLLFPNDTIQHAGVVLGIGTASHLHLYEPATTMGYVSDVHIPRVYSAVTAACLMIKKERFFAAGGLDEEHLKIGYNDVDLCLKVMALGYRNVYVPYATLYHYESASRGSDDVDSAKRKRFEAENAYMRKRWPKQIENDPYYNPNLTRRALGCEIVDLDEKVLTDDMSAENDDEEAR